jgi:quinolinate synthase
VSIVLDTFREPSPSPLLLLGQNRDLASERGVDCAGALPAASDPDLVDRARAARADLGERAFVLGHHYQRDEVIAFADVTGDSFKLARDAAARPEAEFVLFCGVHFMAESADILTSDRQQVILPDLAAGCSMADMAAIAQVEEAWEVLEDAGVADLTVPVTYMNSTAAIKAFTGRHGGTVCTSSNADVALRWAFDRVGGRDGDGKVLFLPDQHLGRNTAALQLGIPLDQCVVFDPRKPNGGLSDAQLRGARMILWRGHCSVHGRFSERNVEEIRAAVPGVNVMVHPECKHEVVTAADKVGSTEYIIRARRRRTRLGVGDRHRAQPGATPRGPAPRAARALPRLDGVLLLDHEPDRPAPSGVGDGVARRRADREPDRGRPRRRALGSGRARPDARAARSLSRRSLSQRPPSPRDAPLKIPETARPA